jgi:hypothetical protein
MVYFYKSVLFSFNTQFIQIQALYIRTATSCQEYQVSLAFNYSFLTLGYQFQASCGFFYSFHPGGSMHFNTLPF